MSGGSRNYRRPENWQPGEDYWIYLPANLSDFFPSRRTPNPRERTRDSWLLVEDRSVGGPDHGYASIPPAAPPPSIPLLLVNETYPARSNSPPPYYQQAWNDRASAEEESRLSPEEQKQAVSKLRKQLYSPHIYNIIRRVGTKSTSSSPAASFQDDEGKRCAVCLEDFVTKQYVTMTPCNHMFHEECIVPWVKSQGKCPVCRFVIAESSPPQGSRNSFPSRHGGAQRNIMF